MGKLIGMFGCGVIVDGYGWKSVFYATGMTAIVLFAPAYFFVYDSPSVHPRISNEERRFIKSAFKELDTNSTTERSDLIDTQNIQRNGGRKCAIIRNVPLWAHIFFMFGGGWLATFVMTELPTFCRNVLHFNIKQAGYVSALPYLSGFVCASLCGSISSWVRRKGLQLRTIYRIFNGIAAIGPVTCLLAITWMGCNASSIIILLVLTMGLRSSIYGGGYLNHLDLFPQNAGFVSAFTDTLFSISGACEPILTNAILQGQHTLSRWHHVFYVGMVIVGLPYIPYFFLVSVKRQTELESSRNKTIKYQSL